MHQSMAKVRGNGKTLDSYTVKAINESIRPGDCVFMRSPNPSKPSYIAKVDKIVSDNNGSNVKVHIRWYYRPEESKGGTQPFHGSKEVFISDHRDVQSPDTIEGKCKVHTFKSYTSLDGIGNDDFFCRFEYHSSTGDFSPNSVAVYCTCEMPYNPDHFMIQCGGCTDWFHPACLHMTVDEAKRIEHLFCQSCSSKEQRILQNPRANSRNSTMKVETKRRRR
ncbi:unnamed protein product [Lactuca saligna]|uniref:Uncharacterized protein n=1 Tax=Lactuca saligna TaxID=75948 RepID=A0AA35ZL75_LACSI|nr:unnamed protein product [Lactuca saligna]